MRNLPENCQVRFIHVREHDQNGLPLARGGATRAVIHEMGDEGAVVAYGEARCCPKDNYCKRVGRSIALERALYALEVKNAGQDLDYEGAVGFVPNGNGRPEIEVEAEVGGIQALFHINKEKPDHLVVGG